MVLLESPFKNVHPLVPGEHRVSVKEDLNVGSVFQHLAEDFVRQVNHFLMAKLRGDQCGGRNHIRNKRHKGGQMSS